MIKITDNAGNSKEIQQIFIGEHQVSEIYVGTSLIYTSVIKPTIYEVKAANGYPTAILSWNATSDAVQYEYKIGEQSAWKKCTQPIQLKVSNGSQFFVRAYDASGRVSPIAKLHYYAETWFYKIHDTTYPNAQYAIETYYSNGTLYERGTMSSDTKAYVPKGGYFTITQITLNGVVIVETGSILQVNKMSKIYTTNLSGNGDDCHEGKIIDLDSSDFDCNLYWSVAGGNMNGRRCKLIVADYNYATKTYSPTRESYDYELGGAEDDYPHSYKEPPVKMCGIQVSGGGTFDEGSGQSMGTTTTIQNIPSQSNCTNSINMLHPGLIDANYRIIRTVVYSNLE